MPYRKAVESTLKVKLHVGYFNSNHGLRTAMVKVVEQTLQE